MRFNYLIVPIITLLCSCSSHSHRTPSTPQGGFLLAPTELTQTDLTGDFAGNPRAEQFIDMMVKKHDFNRQQLVMWLSQTRRLDYVLSLMERQAPNYTPAPRPNGAWLRYRNKFITDANVQNGVAFWNQYSDALARAEAQYGVPAEIIVGIIGVETRWGRVMGKTRIIDGLATLAFDYPRRADYFSSELETFLLMSQHEQDNPLTLRGSFAGAMGYGQFMPSAYQQFAVDFNGDGHINLWDPVDAIGSVANYFQKNGWKTGQPVAIVGSGQAPQLDNGYSTRYSVNQLAQYGLRPLQPLSGSQQVSLLRLDMGSSYQYWFGLSNFYTITRYNHSTHYAMAVWQLGESVRISRQNNL
ncbi:lytic murein transglycosylase B [Rosenbergiella australiborealis]|uniref:Lytic murein transglycosylase B n=1 Tax=Rosenbergiella australiborealis TaxID=1544696 RepID=A0ABS5T947_9GAMM|nr:lytic murein transglycosylase B [Rosenbergiella australiborealis]MBT0728025.1 lytic murein transglycosylase B [Rosenbergiella australiborealis]